MRKVLVVSKVENIQEYIQISKEYGVGFEYNDFFMPDVLESKTQQEEIIAKYRSVSLPEYCTMHGAFMDILIFSTDEKIREVAKERIEQSLEIAEKIGAKAVVFHTNANPYLNDEGYTKRTIDMTIDFFGKMLQKFSKISIYLENMFDDSPKILEEISKGLKEYSNYGVCLDYAHAYISSTSVEKWVEAIHPYVRHIHINDNDGKRDLHLAVGDGMIDWEQFVDTYNTYFTSSTLLIETTLPENQRKSLEYLKKLGLQI